MSAHWLVTSSPSATALHSIIPGETTIDDLMWRYWQRCADLGLTVSFKPYFRLIRNPATTARFGADDRTIRAGDVIHCDVGLEYLRLISDHQELAYVRLPGESGPPGWLTTLLAEGNRLQDIFMAGIQGREDRQRDAGLSVEAGPVTRASPVPGSTHTRPGGTCTSLVR